MERLRRELTTRIVACFVGLSAWPLAADELKYRQPAGNEQVEGRLLARTNLELLFQLADGKIIHLDDLSNLVELKTTDTPFAPLDQEAAAAALRDEFGAGFSVLTSKNYAIAYNCDLKFAETCRSLLEGLHHAFTNYFENHGFTLENPEFPLTAVIFDNEEQFANYAARELDAKMASQVIGYYSFLSNRVAMYDMRRDRPMILGNVVSNRSIPRQQYEINISTIVHEATHQLAFNTGLHRRFSETPLWLAEGMAMYFEAPNRNTARWTGIGGANRLRLPLFKESFLRDDQPLNLEAMIRSDDTFQGDDIAVQYAKTWAFTFFLFKNKRAQLHDYLLKLRDKEYLGNDSPDQRWADFTAVFGTDIEKLELQFRSFMRSVR